MGLQQQLEKTEKTTEKTTEKKAQKQQEKLSGQEVAPAPDAGAKPVSTVTNSKASQMMAKASTVENSGVDARIPANLRPVAEKYAEAMSALASFDMPVRAVRLLNKFNGNVEQVR